MAIFPATIPLEQILVENSSYVNLKTLKDRLVRAGLLTYHCYICGLKDWLGQPISLELDHINGVHNDHRLENLRLLCPNCHSQTPTYCSKKLKKIWLCVCGRPRYRRAQCCRICAPTFHYGCNASSWRKRSESNRQHPKV